jgi:hypothetical protein
VVVWVGALKFDLFKFTFVFYTINLITITTIVQIRNDNYLYMTVKI